MKIKSQKSGKGQNRSVRKQYPITEKVVRFLKAVDLILQEKTRTTAKKMTITSISELVFGNGYTISKIKTGKRNITAAQLEAFATYFGLNYNFFYRDNVDLYFKPKKAKANISGIEKSTVNLESHNHTIQFQNGDNKGNIYFDEAFKRIQNAKTIINQFSTEQPPSEYRNALDKILEKTQKLENTLIKKTVEIKENVCSLSNQIYSLENELKKVILSEASLMKKYIDLLEEKVEWQSQTIEANTPTAEPVME